MKISLVAFNEGQSVDWNVGKKYSIDYNTSSLTAIRKELIDDDSEYILFWDLNNFLPELSTLIKVIKTKGNLWHIGSKIGLQDHPKFLDAIQPVNMLHLPIDGSIDHSSWKCSFLGCLMEKRVFREITLSNFSDNLDIIGLDFGYKSMKSGVFTRYSSELSLIVTKRKIDIVNKDTLNFIKQNFDSKAFVWIYLSNFFTINPFTFFKVFNSKRNEKGKVFKQSIKQNVLEGKDLSVSIIIATLERYKYLEKELKELSLLNIPVKEIIIVDQTPEDIRSKDFLKSFDDLSIIYIPTDKIGQCSARNKGIETATGKFVWFLDDDMEEIPVNYLQKHLETLYSFNADVSCGIPDEIGTKYIDRTIPKIELSDGFPTNDVVVKRSLLNKIGRFDEKMDQMQSEDQELGLRCFKSGALSIKNNQLRIVHLRALRGGLRKHNVRKITFSSSRNNLLERRFLHQSEIYLNLKHFTKSKVKKYIRLNIRGTFIVRGNIIKKSAKVVLAIILLPHTLLKIRSKLNAARKM